MSSFVAYVRAAICIQVFNSATTPSTSSPVPVFSKISPIIISRTSICFKPGIGLLNLFLSPIFSKPFNIMSTLTLWISPCIIYELNFSSLFLNQFSSIFLHQYYPKVFQNLSTSMSTPTLWRGAQALLRPTIGELSV